MALTKEERLPLDLGHFQREFAVAKRNSVKKNKVALVTGANLSGRTVELSEGISRLASLVHFTEHAGQSGETFPYGIMRDTENDLVHFWEEDEMRSVLAQVSHRENIVESADNLLKKKIADFLATAEDETLTVDERIAAVNAGRIRINGYQRYLEEEIARLEASGFEDTLPSDVPTYRRVHIKRLEAKAMARVKDLRWASVQQGVDLPPSCTDEATALTKVAEAAKLARLDIQALETIAEIKARYDRAVSDMDGISSLNTPTFAVNGAVVTSVTATEGQTVAVVSQQVQGVSGRVAFRREALAALVAANVRYRLSAQGVNHQIELRVDEKEALTDDLTVMLRADNLCGVSSIPVTFVKKAA